MRWFIVQIIYSKEKYIALYLLILLYFYVVYWYNTQYKNELKRNTRKKPLYCTCILVTVDNLMQALMSSEFGGVSFENCCLSFPKHLINNMFTSEYDYKETHAYQKHITY